MIKAVSLRVKIQGADICSADSAGVLPKLSINEVVVFSQVNSADTVCGISAQLTFDQEKRNKFFSWLYKL